MELTQKNNKTGAGAFSVAACLLAALCAAALLKTMFVGLEIDEQYALSIGYRLVKGDTLFGTMWEPHQLSALPAAALIALFMGVTGTTTGVLLFVRIVMLAAKAALSLWFYRSLQGGIGRRGAFLAALVLFAYTPKWFLGPDYISQQFHFTLAAFLCFWAYYGPGPAQFRRPWVLVPGSICLCLSFLAFPQSIFAAPVYLAGFWVLGARRQEPRWGFAPRGAVLLAACCAVCGGAFVAYVLHGAGLTVLLAHAKLILNDPQYDFTVAERLALLGSQAVSALRAVAWPLLLALAVAVGGCVQGIAAKNIRNVRYWLNLFFVLWAGFSLLTCLWHTLRDSSLDERYYLPVLVLAGAWFFRRGRGTLREELFWLGYLPGLAAYGFILRSTLLGFSATFMYLMWPAMCGLLAMLCQAGELAAGEQNPTVPFALEEELPQLLLALLLGLLLICRFWLVLVTGWGPANMGNTELAYLPGGPAAGTWADTETADLYGALQLALLGHNGEKILLTTGDVQGLAFLMDGGTLQVGQASVISSTDSDTRFSAYYNELPEKTPELIIYNENCVRELGEFHNWLENNFTITARRQVTCGTAALEVLTVGGPAAHG